MILVIVANPVNPVNPVNRASKATKDTLGLKVRLVMLDNLVMMVLMV